MPNPTTDQFQFVEEVNKAFDAAGRYVDASPGLLDQIRICDSIHYNSFRSSVTTDRFRPYTRGALSAATIASRPREASCVEEDYRGGACSSK